MSITATVKGDAALRKRFRTVEDAINDAAFMLIKKKALDIQKTAIESIAEVSQGESVIRYRPRREHVVSQEGDPPNTDTGRLISSIHVQVDEGDKTASVSSNVEYAVHLEFGTKYMNARPWLQPAIDANKRVRRSEIVVEIDDA
jgi:HK97 gp10 family phage protein